MAKGWINGRVEIPCNGMLTPKLSSFMASSLCQHANHSFPQIPHSMELPPEVPPSKNVSFEAVSTTKFLTSSFVQAVVPLLNL